MSRQHTLYSLHITPFSTACLILPDPTTEDLLGDFPSRAIEVRNLILDHWKKTRDPITLIRHNIGFHHARKQKGVHIGYEAYKDLHPASSEYIMTLFRLLFRILDDVYDYSEPYGITPRKEDIKPLYQMAMELKRIIEEEPFEKTNDAVEKYFRMIAEQQAQADD